MHILDFKGLTDWVEIFKGGAQTDSKGRAHNFTETDLDEIIASHNPAHPVPHVITHKELYSPFAYAQAHELKRDGLSILAKSKNVEPQFEKLIQDGRLFERSIRLGKSKDGKLKLEHIAWLGAEPPAVDGLAPVQFNKDDDAIVIDFMHSSDTEQYQTLSTMARVLRGLREFFISKFSIEDADRFIPSWEVDDLNRRAGAHANFSKNDDDNGGTAVSLTQADIDKAAADAKAKAEADFQKQKDELEAKAKADREQFDKERREFRKAEYAAFVSEQINDGRLLPAQAEGAVEFMQSLAAGDDAEFEFSKGEGDKKETAKVKPADWFRNFVKAMPKQIVLGDRKGGEPVDADDSAAIVKAANDYQREQAAKGIEVSNLAAIAHVKAHAAK